MFYRLKKVVKVKPKPEKPGVSELNAEAFRAKLLEHKRNPAPGMRAT